MFQKYKMHSYHKQSHHHIFLIIMSFMIIIVSVIIMPKNHLNNNVPSKPTGNEVRIAWPSSLPDLSTIDSYMWGYIKKL